MATEFAPNNQTSVDWTLSTDGCAAIAIEVKAQINNTFLGGDL